MIVGLSHSAQKLDKRGTRPGSSSDERIKQWMQHRKLEFESLSGSMPFTRASGLLNRGANFNRDTEGKQVTRKHHDASER